MRRSLTKRCLLLYGNNHYINIPYNFIAVKTVPIKQMKSTAIIWKWQNDVHLTTMKGHYRSIFAPIRHRRGEALSHIVRRDETWVHHSNPWHPEAMNGVMPHDNPKEEIQECVISRQRQSDIPEMRKVLFFWSSCLGRWQWILTAILEVHGVWMLAFVKFTPQQIFQKCCSSVTAQGHTSRELCTCRVILTSFHHTFACLILGKTACEDTMMWMTGYCRTPCTNGHKEWKGERRQLTKMQTTLWNSHAFSNVVVKFREVFTCLTCEQHEISNRRHCLHAREL